jgi:hypothetical protein
MQRSHSNNEALVAQAAQAWNTGRIQRSDAGNLEFTPLPDEPARVSADSERAAPNAAT